MHVIHRGHSRMDCFRDMADFSVYWHFLLEFSPKFDCAIHAYVLMTNHVHLLLTPGRDESASSFMRVVAANYAQYFNRRYQRTGALWEGRFRSCITETEIYLLRCYRYIELNPVRAGIVSQPRDYRWSSYLSNAEGLRDDLVTPQQEFLALGPISEERHLVYRALFDQPLSEQDVQDIRIATNRNAKFGSSKFRQGT